MLYSRYTKKPTKKEDIMANHVTTRITGNKVMLEALTRAPSASEKAEHEEFQNRLKKAMERNGNGHLYTYEPLPSRMIDFDILIPQPENIEVGDCTGRHDEDTVCWYDWNVKNWGTKWNGYELDVSDLDDETVMVSFDTAWSHPEPVLFALSEKFPEESFDVEYADEDIGRNCGRYVIQDGVLAEEPFENDDEAKDFAAELKLGMSYAEFLEE